MSKILDEVRDCLRFGGFEIASAPGPFEFFAQNTDVLVFVIVADIDKDLQTTIQKVLNALSGPFRSKRFGPKTMEMYCVLVSQAAAPLTSIERIEQDIRICRKIVITSRDDVKSQLSFLCPLDETLAAVPEARQVYWAEIEKRLNSKEVAFLKAVDEGNASSHTVIDLARNDQ